MSDENKPKDEKPKDEKPKGGGNHGGGGAKSSPFVGIFALFLTVLVVIYAFYAFIDLGIYGERNRSAVAFIKDTLLDVSLWSLLVTGTIILITKYAKSA